MHATVRAAHPNPRNRSAAIIVGEFAPIATAPFVDARYGHQDTARTVSAIVPSQGALFYLETDSRCLRCIVVCDMPGHKSYSRHTSLALRHSSFVHATKRPRKTGAFCVTLKDRARDYPRAVSGLILRARTAASRHSARQSARSSLENCQQKQAADETVRWKRRSRWKQSWTFQGLSKPMNSARVLRCTVINLGIPDASLNR